MKGELVHMNMHPKPNHAARPLNILFEPMAKTFRFILVECMLFAHKALDDPEPVRIER